MTVDSEWLKNISMPEVPHDCSIQVGTTIIHTHKFVLMAQSPHFRKEFTRQLKDGTLNNAYEETLHPDSSAVGAILNYCYNGCLDEERMGGEHAVLIFMLADEYQISKLKSTMEECLAKTVDVGNVVEMVALANKYSVKELREACVQLMAREKSVVKSDEWKQLKGESPRLATDLIEDVLCAVWKLMDPAISSPTEDAASPPILVHTDGE